MIEQANKITQALRRIGTLAEACDFYAKQCEAESRRLGGEFYNDGKARAFRDVAMSLREILGDRCPYLLTSEVASRYEDL